ncbi:conserved hypothetical protein [Vibrio phage 501E54-1]|nr:conserved hypothetical protein [Vibrio phage 501E54-1]
MESEITERAKQYYAKHLGLDYHSREVIWKQASPEYRQCFLELARIELEDEARMEELFKCRIY